MIERLLRAAEARPMLAIVIGYSVANFFAGMLQYYREHRAEIDAALDNRTRFVRSIRDTIIREESSAIVNDPADEFASEAWQEVYRTMAVGASR